MTLAASSSSTQSPPPTSNANYHGIGNPLIIPNHHQAWSIAFLILAILLYLACPVYLLFGSTQPIPISQEEEEAFAASKKRKGIIESENTRSVRESADQSSNNSQSGQFSASSAFATMHSSLSDSMTWFRRFNPLGATHSEEESAEKSFRESKQRRNYLPVGSRVRVSQRDEKENKSRDGESSEESSSSRRDSGSHEDSSASSSVDSELRPLTNESRQYYGTLGDRVKNKLRNFGYS
jgi:hypothetical protein